MGYSYTCPVCVADSNTYQNIWHASVLVINPKCCLQSASLQQQQHRQQMHSAAAGVPDPNLDDALHVLQGHAANRYTDMSSSSSSQLNKPSAATCSVSSSCAAAAAAVNSPSVCAAAAAARCLYLCSWYDCLWVIINSYMGGLYLCCHCGLVTFIIYGK